MADDTKSYDSSFYADLASSVEQRIGLPDGLLHSVIVNGERSNADQVSEAGARTVAQITPPTRKLAIAKYGIDPYLSPQNAVEVAGLLLKDSLDRNKGSIPDAVGEYIGGTDRSNWGRQTAAYQKRVLSALPDYSSGSNPQMPAPQQGTAFERAQAATAPDDSQSIANVYAAYKSGAMPPEDAKAFESAVNAGHILLPQGATLNAGKAAPEASGQQLPPGVLDAYASGKMDPKDQLQLEQLVKSGHVAVPTDGPANLVQIQQQGATERAHPERVYDPGVIPRAVPGDAQAGLQRDANGQPYGLRSNLPPEPTIGDKVIGAGEAVAQNVTGMIAAPLAAVDSFVVEGGNRLIGVDPQTAGQLGANALQSDLNALVYQPRTAEGQSMGQTLGENIQRVGEPLMGMPEVGMLHALAPAAVADVKAGVRAAPGAVADTLSRAQGAVSTAADAVINKAKSAVGMGDTATPAATPGTMGSVGAAGTDAAIQRRTTAGQLPVPIELTKGQAERSLEQLRFEQETAKDPNTGGALRERFADQNQQVIQNLDAFIDKSGAEAPTARATGETVDNALRSQMQADKAKVRVAYKRAETAGEMEQPVTAQAVIDHLNQTAPETATAPILDVMRKKAVQVGMAQVADDGSLVATPAPLKNIETFRQSVNQATDMAPTNIRQAAIVKGLVDEATDGMGGDLYKQARALRARFAQNYEDRATIAKLLAEKPGTSDRAVALEDVFNHTILNSSLDDVKNVRRVLQRSGSEGWQAWKELQGATLRHIRDEATKGVATDIRGNPIVSPAKLNNVVRGLDHDGKLDFVFGKKGAQQIRDIADLAKVIYTSPPGTVNTSNTASVILSALAESGITGSMTGLPVPVLTGLRVLSQQVKNRRIQQRVNEALGKVKATNKPPQPTHSTSRTVH